MALNMFADRMTGRSRHYGILRIAGGIGVGVVMAILPTGKANCQIVGVGLFAGTRSEGFEGFSDFLHSSNPTTLNIFSDGSTISGSGLLVYKPGTANLSFGTSGTATVADGTNGVDNYTGSATTTINFATTVLKFGAFFGAQTGTGNDPATIIVTFFDAGNAQIGSAQSFTYSRSGNGADGALVFKGWDSTTSIAKATIFGSFVALDAIRVSSTSSQNVPEPGVIGVGVGAGVATTLGLLSRRRRKSRSSNS